MAKTLMLIVNPRAGRSRSLAPLLNAISLFSEADYLVSLRQTTAQGDATRFVRENGAAFDRIVCYGGDGTLNETVTGLMDLPVPPPLGYIPGGSTNDFAASLHLSDQPAEAAKQILDSSGKKLDVGTFNGRPFVYVASFGAFTKASYSAPSLPKTIWVIWPISWKASRICPPCGPMRPRSPLTGRPFPGASCSVPSPTPPL